MSLINEMKTAIARRETSRKRLEELRAKRRELPGRVAEAFEQLEAAQSAFKEAASLESLDEAPREFVEQAKARLNEAREHHERIEGGFDGVDERIERQGAEYTDAKRAAAALMVDGAVQLASVQESLALLEIRSAFDTLRQRHAYAIAARRAQFEATGAPSDPVPLEGVRGNLGLPAIQREYSLASNFTLLNSNEIPYVSEERILADLTALLEVDAESAGAAA